MPPKQHGVPASGNAGRSGLSAAGKSASAGFAAPARTTGASNQAEPEARAAQKPSKSRKRSEPGDESKPDSSMKKRREDDNAATTLDASSDSDFEMGDGTAAASAVPKGKSKAKEKAQRAKLSPVEKAQTKKRASKAKTDDDQADQSGDDDQEAEGGSEAPPKKVKREAAPPVFYNGSKLGRDQMQEVKLLQHLLQLPPGDLSLTERIFVSETMNNVFVKRGGGGNLSSGESLQAMLANKWGVTFWTKNLEKWAREWGIPDSAHPYRKELAEVVIGRLVHNMPGGRQPRMAGPLSTKEKEYVMLRTMWNIRTFEKELAKRLRENHPDRPPTANAICNSIEEKRQEEVAENPALWYLANLPCYFDEVACALNGNDWGQHIDEPSAIDSSGFAKGKGTILTHLGYLEYEAMRAKIHRERAWAYRVDFEVPSIFQIRLHMPIVLGARAAEDPRGSAYHRLHDVMLNPFFERHPDGLRDLTVDHAVAYENQLIKKFVDGGMMPVDELQMGVTSPENSLYRSRSGFIYYVKMSGMDLHRWVFDGRGFLMSFNDKAKKLQPVDHETFAIRFYEMSIVCEQNLVDLRLLQSEDPMRYAAVVKQALRETMRWFIKEIVAGTMTNAQVIQVWTACRCEEGYVDRRYVPGYELLRVFEQLLCHMWMIKLKICTASYKPSAGRDAFRSWIPDFISNLLEDDTILPPAFVGEWGMFMKLVHFLSLFGIRLKDGLALVNFEVELTHNPRFRQRCFDAWMSRLPRRTNEDLPRGPYHLAAAMILGLQCMRKRGIWWREEDQAIDDWILNVGDLKGAAPFIGFKCNRKAYDVRARIRERTNDRSLDAVFAASPFQNVKATVEHFDIIQGSPNEGIDDDDDEMDNDD